MKNFPHAPPKWRIFSVKIKTKSGTISGWLEISGNLKKKKPTHHESAKSFMAGLLNRNTAFDSV
jgi:hypothetical protein